jgi:uncharacterized membrane protein YhaH (DUF805 family)
VADVEWYYTRGDERLGPVSFTRLKELARSGEIDPRGDLAWSRGMLDWIIAGEVEGLFSKRTTPTLKLKEDEVAPMTRVRQVKDWRSSPAGTGRLGYIMGTVVAPVILAVLIAFGTPWLTPYLGTGMGQNLPLALFLLIPLVGLMTTISRLKNLGMSGWWVLGFLVPFLNLWLGFRCLAGPPDYAFAKKLDGVGFLLGALYWLSFIVAIAAPILVQMNGDKFPELKKWMDDAKAGHASIPWEMKDGAKPAAGPVKK